MVRIWLAKGEPSLTLKIKIGKKGYVILPKAIREAVGINEGDEVIVEIKDGILLKPIRKIDIEEVRKALIEHVKKIKEIPNALEPKPGEIAKVYLEEEFET